MFFFQLEFRKLHQPVNGKVQSLNDFKQAEMNLHLRQSNDINSKSSNAR